ncbi:MAG: L-serine ammonia-lyase [Sphaerochaetaceae bacterium]|nr:L-serine ammonia-lyase [Sphaerochaetaceae bacterium]
MESLRELYRIGYGPSSSHTMGPRYAMERFIEHHPEGDGYLAELYGSLAATGKGHLTDKAIREVCEKAGKKIDIRWYPDTFKPFHPNALTIKAVTKDAKELAEKTYYSVGGGKIVTESQNDLTPIDIYPKEHFGSMAKLLNYCSEEGMQLWEAVLQVEGEEIMDYIQEVWQVMKTSILNGLDNEGVLPGGLKLQRKASQVYAKSQDFKGPLGETKLPVAYALAVSEENAGGGKIVTAPTCGSCGVLPAVLYCLQQQDNLADKRIYRALLTAGIVGNIVKENGSISGAEVGCQGEVGVACAMAGAAATQLLGGSIYQIEYAAEMGLEHHLGLTCDPMRGLVQIPCIERNAMAAMRALDHSIFALFSDGRHRVSFDAAVEVMMETGQALPSLYRETSMGGLALLK